MWNDVLLENLEPRPSSSTIFLIHAHTDQWELQCSSVDILQSIIPSVRTQVHPFILHLQNLCWPALCPCCPSWICWCQSLVLEVIFEGLGQRKALNFLKPFPTQRQAGRTSTQVLEREGLSWGEGRTATIREATSNLTYLHKCTTCLCICWANERQTQWLLNYLHALLKYTCC